MEIHYGKVNYMYNNVQGDKLFYHVNSVF